MTTATEAAATTTRRIRADEPDLLEALLLGAGPHLEPLLDVGSTANGDLLLVQPEPAHRLAELLDGGAVTRPGEAVTVLVPLAEALRRLHEAGVALNGVDGGAVVLDADGSPSWSPSRAVLLRRAGPAAFSAAVESDLSGFAALADGLLARTGAEPVAAGRALPALVDELFALARPVPVRLSGGNARPSGAPGRLLGVAAPPRPEPAPADRSVSIRAVLGPLAVRVGSAAASVRRRTWIALGTVATLLVAALLLLPGGGPAEAVDVVPTPATASAAPSPSQEGAVAPRTLSAERALPALLVARARCLGAGGGRCIDRVDGAGTPLRQADERAIAAGTDPVLPPDERPRFLSQGGGTAVARVGRSVVVAVREPDGWRLRDVVAEPPG